MTATHQMKLSSTITMIAIALIFLFLGFFGRNLISKTAGYLNDNGETTGDQAVCDTSSLLNEVPTGVVLAGPLNLRAGPGLNYAVLSQLKICSIIRLTGRSSDNAWLEVETSNKDQGWVFSPYVQANINILDLEINNPSRSPNTGNTPGGSSSGINLSVFIEENQAVAYVSGMPANKEIRAVLSPANDSQKSLLVAVGRTDGNGNVTLNFPMPVTWPDGSILTSGKLRLALTAGSVTRTLQITYFAN